ncbi:DNA helicase [Bacillus cereus]
MSREKYKLIRSIMLKDLKRDLVGPEHEKQDIITEPPSQAYITGILYPLESEKPIEEELDEQQASFEADHATYQDTEEEDRGTDDDAIVRNNSKVFKQQNSMGIKFYVKNNVNDIVIKGRWGKYSKSKKFDEKKEKDVPIWIRETITFKKRIDINVIESPIEVLEKSNVHLFIKKHFIKDTDNLLISVFLSNRNIDKNSNNALFQVELELSNGDKKGIFLCENEARKDNTNFDEFLYRNKPIFARGFGCAVNWENDNSEYAKVLKTNFIPTHEVASMSTELPEDNEYGIVPKGYLSIKQFSEETRKENVAAKLDNLANRYEFWIDGLPVEAVADKISAQQSIEKCRDALSRMRTGIELIRTDSTVFEAFKFMNQVMHTQICMKKYAKNRNETTLEDELNKESFDWRPFQLAFILINIKGLTHPESDERKIVDLLWFPTGGGKTEAYLGIAAFLLGYRRMTISNCTAYNKDGGVTILLRYTLRLLTTQQRDRLMRVICACEYIRGKNSDKKLGKSEFSVGFWVGGQVTANEFKDLSERDYISTNKVKYEYEKLKKQVLECPCCGEKNLEYKFLPNNETTTVKQGLEIYCTNNLCFFSKRHVPVYLIDEEIYRRAPSIIIGTVDKFARLPWDEKTATVFGKVDRLCEKCGYIAEGEGHAAFHRNPKANVSSVKPFYPPELIIQDELHLITGPLGTIYGSYETAIEELCSCTINGKVIKPKYVAATATIKNAGEQIKRVFGRVTFEQFPPPGLEVENSFFSREEDVEEVPFRLYAGVCVTGSSMKTVLLRVYASLLQTTETLSEDPELKEYIDPYRTLIGYFNSIRELGGAVRLLEDDVDKRIQTLQKKYGYSKRRYINRKEELTSRIPSSKIPKVLELLEKKINNNELDVALATNMISVGMDVDRLGLMVVTGQPKQTAEYIQASSRVGRSKPGLVVTVYNPYRPRDLSHYQNFKGYHSRLYHYVEGTTATPFASRARDRALHAIAVAILRLTDPILAKNQDAINIKNVNLHSLKEIIRERVSIVESKNTAKTIKELDEFLDKWINIASIEKILEYYFYADSKKARTKTNKRILRRFGEKAKGEAHEKPTVDSMRQIEGTSKLYIYEGWEK